MNELKRVSEMKIKVWDLPIRICHWLLVIIIAFQFISVKVLDEEMLANATQWHFYGGYACLAIVIFRILWGVLGTYYAKFSQFVISPVKTLHYLRGKGLQDYIGHNPAGAYSVVALLSLILAQAISGLFTTDDIFNDAPYYGVLNNFWQAIANFIHHNIVYVLLGFIVLHIGVILFYKIKHKKHLTSAMITGKKTVNEALHSQGSFPWLGFIVCIAMTAITLYFIIEIWPPVPVDDYFGY
ncbi:MAG: cytochrome b [Cognaticolwellia sp.]|jgi:cytochrome b